MHLQRRGSCPSTAPLNLDRYQFHIFKGKNTLGTHLCSSQPEQTRRLTRNTLCVFNDVASLCKMWKRLQSRHWFISLNSSRCFSRLSHPIFSSAWFTVWAFSWPFLKLHPISTLVRMPSLPPRPPMDMLSGGGNLQKILRVWMRMTRMRRPPMEV